MMSRPVAIVTGAGAAVVANLASGDFAFASGSVIVVDGGLSIPRL